MVDLYANDTMRTKMKPYPLVFEPHLKEVIWGGEAICRFKNISSAHKQIGESWEVSVIPGAVSMVKSGPMKGMTLEELVDIMPVELLGQSVIDRFGKRFPLLVKFIDAAADLSVQVHPGDELAMERHGTSGKSEMWYVIDAEPGSRLVSGFSVPMDKAEYSRRVAEGTLEEVLKYIDVNPGDVFFLPSGRVHAIGRGIFLAEIQQSSDITYRMYDYQRKDAQGNYRPLHVEDAGDAIDYTLIQDPRTHYPDNDNEVVSLLRHHFFSANKIRLTQPLEIHRSYQDLDSFVLLVCMGGNGYLRYEGGEQALQQGTTVLLPAALKNVTVGTDSSCLLMEAFV